MSAEHGSGGCARARVVLNATTCGVGHTSVHSDSGSCAWGPERMRVVLNSNCGVALARLQVLAKPRSPP